MNEPPHTAVLKRLLEEDGIETLMVDTAEEPYTIGLFDRNVGPASYEFVQNKIIKMLSPFARKAVACVPGSQPGTFVAAFWPIQNGETTYGNQT